MNIYTKRFLGRNLVSGLLTIAVISSTFLNKNDKQTEEYKPTVDEIVYVEDGASETETQVTAPVQPMGLIKITASALNVRETPNGKVAGCLKKDEISYIYGFLGNWLQVLYNGSYGFVYSKYTEIYDFTNVKVSIDDIHTVYAVNESLETKELSESDIQVLKSLEDLQKNALVAALEATKPVQPDNTPEQVITEDEIAKQVAEAQTLALKQQQDALAAQQALAEQVAQQQAALIAEQQAAAQKALEAQMAEAAKRQELLAKDPTKLSTPELCQYVLAQIITPDMDDFAKARAINNWLCDHMTYDLNYYTTRDALLIGRGRCQGYANAYKNLMNTAGIPTDFIGGYGNGGRHGWNRVLINGAYYYVDVTWNDSTGNYSRYLLISEAEMNMDHQPSEINPRTE